MPMPLPIALTTTTKNTLLCRGAGIIDGAAAAGTAHGEDDVNENAATDSNQYAHCERGICAYQSVQCT